MKSIVMPQTVELNEEIKNQLNEETEFVEETLASPQGKDAGSHFTAVDMWNCQRQSRSATSMMRWNLN